MDILRSHSRVTSRGRWLFPYLLALIPLVALIIMVIRYKIDVPVLDQWSLPPLIEKSYQGALSLEDVWGQHHEHRIPFPIIVMLFLARLSSWNLSFELAAIILLALGVFISLVYQLSMTARSSGAESARWMIPIFSMMVFSLNQSQNWLWGWQITLMLNTFAVVAGIVLLAHPVFRWWRLVLASLMGIIATHSFANGIIYWVIGLFILIVKHSGNRKVISVGFMWGLASLFGLGTYFYGYSRPDYLQGFGASFERLWEFVEYVFAYLGSPLVTDQGTLLGFAWDVSLIGFMGVLLFCWLCYLLLRSPRFSLQGIVPYIALVMYASGSALVTGFGRAGLGIEQSLSSRYITISCLLWVSSASLIYLILIDCSHNLSSRMSISTQKTVLGSILAVIVFWMARSSIQGIEVARARYQYLLPAQHELLRLQDQELFERLYGTGKGAFSDEFREGLKIMESRGLGLLAENSDSVETHLIRGDSYRRWGWMEEAMATYARALDADSAHSNRLESYDALVDAMSRGLVSGDQVVLSFPWQERFLWYFSDGAVDIGQNVFILEGWNEDEIAMKLLSSALDGSDRVWLVLFRRPNADPGSEIERILDSRGYLAMNQWHGEHRLVLYGLPVEEPEQGWVAGTVDFGGQVELESYSLEESELEAGGVVKLGVRWRALTDLENSYKVFIHIVGPDGKLWGQQDTVPGNGFRPTSGWEEGDAVEDRYGVLISAEAPPGAYELRIGLYEENGGERLQNRTETSSTGDALDYCAVEVVEVIR